MDKTDEIMCDVTVKKEPVDYMQTKSHEDNIRTITQSEKFRDAEKRKAVSALETDWNQRYVACWDHEKDNTRQHKVKRCVNENSSTLNGFLIKNSVYEGTNSEKQNVPGSRVCQSSEEQKCMSPAKQTSNKSHLPEVKQMIPETGNDGTENHLKIAFIKTEDGKMQCLNCHSFFYSLEGDNHICSKNQADISRMPSLVTKPISINMGSTFSDGLQSNRVDVIDTPAAGMKTEYEESELVGSRTPSTHVGREELTECSKCNIFFNDRCAYLDHKLYFCESSEERASLTHCSGLTNEEQDNLCIKVEKVDDLSSAEDNNDLLYNNECTFNKKRCGEDNQGSVCFPELRESESLNFSCPYCKSNFDDFFALNIHRRSCKKPGIGTNVKELCFRTIICTICKETFRSRYEYSQHIVSSHILRKPKCGQKRKQSTAGNNSSLETVKMQETKRTKHKLSMDAITEDYKQSSDIKLMYSTYLQEFGPKEDALENDNLKTESSILSDNLETLIQDRKTEMESKEGINTGATNNDVDKESSHYVPCTVDGCFNYFQSDVALNKHIIQVHGLTKNLNNEAVHQCQNKGCGRSFDTKELLKEHIQDAHLIHDLPTFLRFECSLCGRTCNLVADIKKHIEELHGIGDCKRYFKRKVMNHCKICYSDIETKLFMEHYSKCQKRSFVQSFLNKSSVETNKCTQTFLPQTEKCIVKQEPENVTANPHMLNDLNRSSLNTSSEDNLGDTCFNVPGKDTEGSRVRTKVGSLECGQVYDKTYFYKNLEESFTDPILSNVAERDSFRCRLCKLIFPKKYVLNHLIKCHNILDHLPTSERHISENHKDIFSSKNIAQKSDAVLECLDLDSSLLPYKCSVIGCNKAFLYKRDLTTHRGKHKDSNGFYSQEYHINKQKHASCEQSKNREVEYENRDEVLYPVSGFKIEIEGDS